LVHCSVLLSYFHHHILEDRFHSSVPVRLALEFCSASPGFLIVGSLSDKHGRKPFMLAGLFLACALFYPCYIGLYHFGPYVDPTAKALVANPSYSPVMLSFLVFVMTTFVCLVYGPIAAFLVELFPTSIRYTSMSLPYHIGNGVFGGIVSNQLTI